MGTFHKLSPKHLHRYVTEFAGRKNVRNEDTITQMTMLARGLDGKLMPWKRLTTGPRVAGPAPKDCLIFPSAATQIACGDLFPCGRNRVHDPVRQRSAWFLRHGVVVS